MSEFKPVDAATNYLISQMPSVWQKELFELNEDWVHKAQTILHLDEERAYNIGFLAIIHQLYQNMHVNAGQSNDSENLTQSELRKSKIAYNILLQALIDDLQLTKNEFTHWLTSPLQLENLLDLESR